MKRVLEINDINPLIISGPNDENIKLIEQNFESMIVLRGNQLNLSGKKKDLDSIEKIVQEMILIGLRKEHVSKNDVNTLISFSDSNDDFDIQNEKELIILNSHKAPIVAKTNGQKKYFKAVLKNDIVFAIGPAGTGKTYQAVALAVASLKKKETSKIVVTRPVVEAGERLGFLPGDLKEKVDPYLTPLYDAFNDMLPKEKLKKYLLNRTIEIAPLAYMRGRTLHNSFMILDEAQNATQGQMKMFLTRLGVTSKAIITGDVTQIDLPSSNQSGLMEASKILNKVKGIEFINFTSKDVVRHELVKNIINAYEKNNGKE